MWAPLVGLADFWCLKVGVINNLSMAVPRPYGDFRLRVASQGVGVASFSRVQPPLNRRKCRGTPDGLPPRPVKKWRPNLDSAQLFLKCSQLPCVFFWEPLEAHGGPLLSNESKARGRAGFVCGRLFCGADWHEEIQLSPEKGRAARRARCYRRGCQALGWQATEVDRSERPWLAGWARLKAPALSRLPGALF